MGENSMDVLTSALILYAITAVLVGIYLFRERLGIDLRPKRNRVGPSYWGVYSGSDVDDQEAERRIELHPVENDDESVVGSGMYASGRAIKSARS